MFLGYSNQQPLTRDQFVQREKLRSRLQTLEKRCVGFRNFRDNEQRSRDKPQEDLTQLIREFWILEIQVERFKQIQSAVYVGSSEGLSPFSGMYKEARTPPTNERTITESDTHSGICT